MGGLKERLLKEYQDLNGTHYETLDCPPSALEFMRIVSISRPVLFKGMPLGRMSLWTDDYLAQKVGSITVATTPDGRADSLVEVKDGTTYFAEPHNEVMSMWELLERLTPGTVLGGQEITYLQSQNGNLINSQSGDSEFKSLLEDIERDIPWASEALGRNPDAVNIWIGNNRSVTSTHNDPYENLYTVVRGTKKFTLFPPTEGWCLEERSYPHARWTRIDGATFSLQPSPDHPPVRWSSVKDPTSPLPPARPLQIAVGEGEMLYLPAGWWHYVQQEGDKFGKCIAVNWWYDITMQGSQWVWLSFLRRLGNPVSFDEEGDDTENE